MPLFYIYYIVVGVCLCGIGYVLWLMKAETDQKLVEKIAPEDLKQFDAHGKISQTKGKLSMAATRSVPKTANVNQVMPSITKNPAKTQSGRPAAENDPFIKKFFEKKPPKNLDSRLLKMKPAPKDPGPTEPKKSNGLFDKLSMKFSFGKKKMNPQDDIPQATTFASLTKKSNPKSEKKITPEGTGTASLTTVHYPDTNQQDSASVKREQESSAQLEDWKNKYEKLEALFNENSQKLVKAESSLTNELKNREDFFKLKAILESEIKEVKDRAKELQASLRNARMETEQQKIQAEQLKDKTADLEEAIQEKNLEMERLKKPDSPQNEDSSKET